MGSLTEAARDALRGRARGADPRPEVLDPGGTMGRFSPPQPRWPAAAGKAGVRSVRGRRPIPQRHPLRSRPSPSLCATCVLDRAEVIPEF